MVHEKQIIKSIAHGECRRISTSVIRRLQKYRGNSLLSGDDTVLRNSWDEICVQVQDDRSLFWEAYVAMIEQLVEWEVNNLDDNAQTAIWLQTENCYMWDEDEDDPPDTVFSDVVGHVIHNCILEEARRWSNWRIRHYLEERHVFMTS